jgi:signal transduction histidine kinase
MPSIVIVLVAVAVAWRARQIRARFAHASQASRLTALFLALAAPSVVFYPSLVEASGRARRQVIESRYAPEVMDQRKNLQRVLKTATAQIDALPDLAELVRMGEPVVSRPAPYEAAFRVWERTVLERDRVTSSVELYDAAGSLVSRFALKLPHAGGPQIYQESSCEWETFEEVSPFFAEERRLLHAGRGVCIDTPSGRTVVGSIAVHVMLDYSNLSFISARSPYTALLRGQDNEQREVGPRERVEFNVYGWSRSPLYVSGRTVSGRTVWSIDSVFDRIFASRDPFWARVASGGTEYEIYFLNDRFGIYALGYPLTGAFGHLLSIAELVVLGAATFLLLMLGGFAYGLLAARTPASGRALLREVRASFYRKLFLAFVAVAVGPVLALALLTRAYIAALMQEDFEMEAARTAASASRVVEDVRMFQMAGMTGQGIVDDNLLVWLSRVIAQDVNIFDRTILIASSERSLFAYGLLPRSTPGDIYRRIILDGRPSYVTRESVGLTEYLVAAAPVRVQDREAILTVPLTLRQQEIESEIDELDRRVLLGAVLFIVVGALIGYSLAERIADPVNRLMRATDRIARGDLRARVVATSSDELRRLVEAFNDMAARLEQQRIELERTNRLKAWAEAARQVAHDVKNPLTPIQLNAEHLRRVHQDHGEPLGPVLDECVDNILQQVRLLRRIANEFSSFASTPSVRPAPESLRELVSEVLRPYRTALHERVAIEEDVPAALPPVLVDKGVLARALTNVVENALHAMPDEGTLRVSARALDEDHVELAVADTGVGMSEADLARIFEPYFSTRAAGTGLGLTIARRNVEANGGSIAVESEVGRGTTVRITLPTARAAA